MLKFFTISLVFFYSYVVLSQVPGPALTQKTLLHCSEQNGDLAHSILQLSNSDYRAIISHPIRYKKLTEAEVKKGKQLWKEWDGKGPQPIDLRKRSVSIPIENIFSTDTDLFSQKIDFFNSLFPPIDSTIYIPYNYGSFDIIFDELECKIAKVQGHLNLVNAACESFDTVMINGIEITQRIFQIYNEISTQVVFDPQTHKSHITKVHKVKASLILRSKRDDYSSSYTYRPDGNDKTCYLGDKKLTSFAN